MIAGWMLYVVVMSAMVTVAALSAERVARDLGHPLRFAWAVGLLLVVAVSAFGTVRGTGETVRHGADRSPEHRANGALSTLGVETPRGVGGPAWTAAPSTWSVPESLATLDRPLLGLWASGSLIWAGLLIVSAVRLTRLQSACRAEVLDGTPVYVSHDVGPALFGVLRHSIVLPAWVLALPASDRALILQHEREHARARDPVVLAGAAIVVLLLPWNPFVWLMFARLRFALEADCDARVLAQYSDVRAYGSLLLTVGERTLAGASPVLALAEAPSHLERRLRLMTAPRKENLLLRPLLAGIVGASLIGAAWQLPRPRATPPELVARSQPSFLEYRWIAPTAPGAGAPAQYTDPTSGEPLVLSDSVIIDISDIDSSWVTRDVAGLAEFGGWSLAVKLTASGAAKVGASTATRVGQRLAVVIDGRIVTVATVNSALGSVLPVAQLPQAVADSLTRRINQSANALRTR